MYRKIYGALLSRNDTLRNLPHTGYCRTDTLHDMALFWNDLSKDGAVFVQFDGTLYNRKAIALELGADPELSCESLISEGFCRWGTALFAKLDGRFALALFERTTQKLYLVKDRIASHTLYYGCVHGGGIVFADSIEAILESGYFCRKVSAEGLSCYFSFGFVIQPNTIYENIYKVKAGAYLCYDLSTQTMPQHYYWKLDRCYTRPKTTASEEEVVAEAHRLLIDSVRKRIGTSKSTGLLLSGGYDSCTLAAILQHETDADIRSYTIGFEEAGLNEAPYAKGVADYLQMKHTQYCFRDSDALRIVPELAKRYEEPFSDEGAVPTLLLSQMIARDQIDTIFCGDGGDEVFATADNLRFFANLLYSPLFMKRQIARMLRHVDFMNVSDLEVRYNFSTRLYKLKHYLHAEDIPQMVRTKMTLFQPSEIARLCGVYRPFETPIDELSFGAYAEVADKITGTYFFPFMSDGELVKTYGAFLGTGIAVREPYLDDDLVAYMATVPQEIKIKKGLKKSILKQIAHTYIPKALLDRPKHGFTIPSSRWMRGVLKPLLLDLLSEASLAKDETLDTAYVIGLRDRFLSGDTRSKYKLWSILIYRLWYMQNIR